MEKNSEGSSIGNQKHRNLICNWCHKKGHIKSNCWSWKKKMNSNNHDSSANLATRDEVDVLSVTNKLVSNNES